MGVGGQCHAMAALPPGKSPGIYGTGGLVDLMAGLNRYEEGKFSCPPVAFEPQIVQTIASHYTNMLSPFIT